MLHIKSSQASAIRLACLSCVRTNVVQTSGGYILSQRRSVTTEASQGVADDASEQKLATTVL